MRAPRRGRLRFDLERLWDARDIETIDRIAAWMEANGCRDWVAVEPIVVKGRTIYYTSLGRRDGAHPVDQRMVVRGDEVVTRVRGLRVRIRWPGRAA